MVRNSRGFTLAEALVAVAISATVGAAMWAVIENAIGSSAYFTDRQELDEAMRQAQFLLLRPDTCHDNLLAPGDVPVTFTGSTVQIAALRNRMAGPGMEGLLLRSNTDFGKIRIGQMTLEESTPNAVRPTQIIYAGTTAIVHDVFFVTLNIPATTRNGRTLDRRQIPLKILVPRPPDPQQIRRCFIQNRENQMCAAFGGSFEEETGNCNMPVCNDTNVAFPCPPKPGWTCSPPVYFWGFTNDPNSANLGPRCLCAQSCQPPPPAGGPGGGY